MTTCSLCGRPTRMGDSRTCWHRDPPLCCACAGHGPLPTNELLPLVLHDAAHGFAIGTFQCPLCELRKLASAEVAQRGTHWALDSALAQSKRTSWGILAQQHDLRRGLTYFADVPKDLDILPADIVESVRRHADRWRDGLLSIWRVERQHLAVFSSHAPRHSAWKNAPSISLVGAWTGREGQDSVPWLATPLPRDPYSEAGGTPLREAGAWEVTAKPTGLDLERVRVSPHARRLLARAGVDTEHPRVRFEQTREVLEMHVEVAKYGSALADCFLPPI